MNRLLNLTLAIGLLFTLASCFTGGLPTPPPGAPERIVPTQAPSAGGGGTDIGSAEAPRGGATPQAAPSAMRSMARPWFTDPERTLKVCFEISPDFGVSPDDARDALREAFHEWRDRLGDTAPTHYDLKSPCVDENDLRVYFGTLSPEAKGALKTLPRRVALLRQTRAFPEQHWASGFLWIAPNGYLDPAAPTPDWRKPGEMRSLLIEKLGETYGVLGAR